MKNTKAAKIAKMLTAGQSVTYIKRMLAVSESYIYAIKKQLEAVEPVENDDDVVRPRLVGPHTVKRVTKAEAEAIKAKAGEFIQASTNNVDAILNTRATTYGSFIDVSRMAQRLKNVAHTAAGDHNKTFAADQAEALDMIFSKIARIINGDADHVDSWVDIAGYAKLVSDRLEGKVR